MNHTALAFVFPCDDKLLMAEIKCTKCQTVGGKDNFIGKVSSMLAGGH